MEQKNGTIKAIITRLNDKNPNATVNPLLEKASFRFNMFSGNKMLSSFELVRGYQPSVVGLLRTFVIQELLDVHKQKVATRKLQELLHSGTHQNHQPELFNPGGSVWVFYKTSKK